MTRKEDKGDHYKTIKENKGDQPISGETTWTTLILERHDLAENSTRQSNLEMACCYLRPTTGHYGCPMMMMMMMMMAQIIIWGQTVWHS